MHASTFQDNPVNTTATALPGAVPQRAAPSIRHLPVNLFASVMGISGLAMAWRLAVPHGAPPVVGEALGVLALVLFAIIGTGYLAKASFHTDAVRAEFTHPVSGNFFGTVAISLLLLSAVIGPWHAGASHAVWTLGAALTLTIGYVAFSRLVSGGLELAQIVPAWIIPGVASLDIPVTGAHLPLPWAAELNLAGLAIGTVAAVVLYTLIVLRIATQPALPPAMKPSLAILMAPLAVGFLAYVNMNGHVDAFAAMLFWFGVFAFAVTTPMVFRRDVPFTPTWWAISFPLAALSNAAFKYADAVQAWPLVAFAWALLVFLTVVLAVLLVKTVRYTLDGRLLHG